MADNSSNNGSGQNNWRNRVGVKDSMPKLSDEFKSDAEKASSKPAQRAPAPRPQSSAGAQSARPAPRPVHKPVARPAPMAPRRPAAPVAPTASHGTPPIANQAASQAGNTFGDRLRAQREAAEALAKKRTDEIRQRNEAASSPNSGQPDSGPKFGFADEEIKAASNEPRQASQQQAATRQQPRAPFKPASSGNTGSVPRPYQPSDAYRKTHGYREYDGRSTEPVQSPQGRPSAPAHNRYADDQVGGQSGNQAGYAPTARREYQPPQGRPGEYYEDGNDELFDDRQVLDNRSGSAQQAPQRAGASDYTAAYRDYDEAFDYEEDEPRGRGGVWVFVLLMLLVVAAIAAGAYWFINFGTKIGTADNGNSGVPTVSAPETPVKVEPKAVDTTTPGAPVRRKKIYDRILGNQTLEPEKLAPSEEQPKTLPPAVVPDTPPTTEAPIGIEPLPLPLPPPPTIPGVQGSLSQKTNQVASAAPPTSGNTQLTQTTIAPTSAKQNTSTLQAGGQQAPLPLPTAVLPGQQIESQAETPVQAPPLPRSKPAEVITMARQANEQSRLAALTQSVAPAIPVAPRSALPGGTGPVQIGPGTSGSQNFAGAAPVVQTPVTPQVVTPAPPTTIASLPQPNVQQPTQVTSPGSGYVLQMSSFRNRNAASAEYRRLITSHATILRGLSPEIREADLGASGKFYKLRLGSVADRAQASRLCNSLIAAGEKDCLVRSR